jgi:ribosome-associated translation inhibitor RaiA
MQVILNTDNNLTGSEDLTARVEAEVQAAMDRFGERITRVEVHLGDENSGKAGANDKRCMMEARLAGLAPVAVTAQGESFDLAITAAAEKLERLLESTLGRLDDRQTEAARDAGKDAQ